jgi:DNA-binding response OmpR family regulator
MPGDREKAIDGGANDSVPKPVDIDRLLSAVCDLLDPPDGPPGGPAAAPVGAGDADTGPPERGET